MRYNICKIPFRGRLTIFGLDLSIIMLLVILGAALVLFSNEKIPAEIVGLGVMLAIILTGVLPTEEAFRGFGSDTVMLLLGLLILTAALNRTGVVEISGRAIMRHAGDNPNRLMVIITSATAALSAVMSNTASAAFFLPITLGLARRARISISKLLMPLAFAAILPSSVTLIATSTNIVVSGLISQYGMEPIGMFEMAPVGLPILIVGLIYMFTIGKRLIPDRADPVDVADDFGLRAYLTEILILPDSPLIGKTIAAAGLGRDLDLTIVRVVRNRSRYLVPEAELVMQKGDVLLVEGRLDDILKIKQTAGIDIKADVKLADPHLPPDDLELVEAVVMPRSPLIGRTLKGVQFRERFGVQVLAVNRGSETLHRKISMVPLRLGDSLLVQGPKERISILQEERVFQVLGPVGEKLPNVRRAPIAIFIFAGVLLLAAVDVIPLSVAVLLGALLAFATRCITPEEAYRDVDWRILILIGSMLALGAAMEETGTARLLAGEIIKLLGNANPIWMLAAFFTLTVIFTQPMSNQAAAAVVIPVAVQTAVQLGMNPRTFAMMIAVAASCSYLTPLEPACLMVYGPGRYRFFDFVKVGSILTVFIFVIALVLVPMIWPLY